MNINHKTARGSKPLVAIKCLAYNHGQFIRDALEGFVMQRTDFPFVAIVHDDASTDGTAAIIREYADRYPEIIIPVLETENLYSRRDGSLSRVVQEALDATGARYVAFCEGDDYWTDPLKLQKQVDFLEANPDYSLCFHNAVVHWENGRRPDTHVNGMAEDRDFSGIYIYRNYYYLIATASIVVRAEVLGSDCYLRAKASRKFLFGDLLVCLAADAMGKIRYQAYNASVYRRHSGGWTFTTMSDPFLLPACHRYIPIYFGPKYKIPVRNRVIGDYHNITTDNIERRNYRVAARSFILALRYSPLRAVSMLAKYYLRKFKG